METVVCNVPLSASRYFICCADVAGDVNSSRSVNKTLDISEEFRYYTRMDINSGRQLCVRLSSIRRYKCCVKYWARARAMYAVLAAYKIVT